MQNLIEYKNYMQALPYSDQVASLTNVLEGQEHWVLLIGVLSLSIPLYMKSSDTENKQSWVEAYENAQLDRKKTSTCCKVVVVVSDNGNHNTAWMAERLGGTLSVEQLGPLQNIKLIAQLKKETITERSLFRVEWSTLMV